MPITKLRAENFKRLVAVSIEPDGNLVRITGKNGAGKTSVLDAIFAALAGKDAAPSKPVRRGEKHALVELHLSDPKVVVRRTFEEDGASALVIESFDGARFPSPQRMLDELLGKLTFDPLAFLAKKPADQVDVLLSVVAIDADPAKLEQLAPESLIEDPIRRLDYRHDKVYQERARQNVLRDQAAAELKAMGQPEGEAPTAPVNVTALVKERDEHRREQAKQKAHHDNIAALEARKASIKKSIELLLSETDVITNRIDSATKEAEGFIDPATRIEELDEKIDTAEAVNERYNQELRRNAVKTRFDEHSKFSADKTALLAAIKAYKEEIVAKAKMPVDGLGWQRDADSPPVVTLDGLPLDQASHAAQLRVSAAIAMAVNPKLKVMLIREGNLLDDDGVKLLSHLAEKNGFQIFMESVDSSGKIGVVIVDGQVAAVNRKAGEADEGEAARG